MSFRLKNAGVTYQRDMKKIFLEMMYITMEDYVDEILEKSITKKDHLTILGKFFDKLEEYNLWLNPKKCVFKVNLGKVLG